MKHDEMHSHSNAFPCMFKKAFEAIIDMGIIFGDDKYDTVGLANASAGPWGEGGLALIDYNIMILLLKSEPAGKLGHLSKVTVETAVSQSGNSGLSVD